MRRKIFDAKNERQTYVTAMEQAIESGDQEAFKAAEAKVNALNTKIASLEALEAEKDRFGGTENNNGIGVTGDPKKACGVDALCKMLTRQKLSDDESAMIRKALITGDNAVSGENYLIPEDVSTEIRELRRSYVSARELVNVIPVTTLSGSTTVESGAAAGLSDFDDGDDIPGGNEPTFVKKPWTIRWRGKLIPVSRALLKTASGLYAYLNRWFVRNATITENKAIFATLKKGYNSGTPKEVSGWAALKALINKDLDPACRIDGVIATNQSGFACLDGETYPDGKPVLQPNPAMESEYLFAGLPIKVYADAELPNIDGTHFPMFVGATRSGADMYEFDGLLIDSSEHYLFNKNQDCLRVVEGFDVITTDGGAYIYASFSSTPAG